MRTKKLKIAILIRSFSGSRGGAERYCVELTKKLSKFHEVHVFSQEIMTLVENVTFHKINSKISKPRFVNQIIFSLVTKQETKNKFDIIHSHDMVTHANVYTIHVPCFKTKFTKSNLVSKFIQSIGMLISLRKLSYLLLEYFVFKPNSSKQIISVSNLLMKNIKLNYPNSPSNVVAYPGFSHRESTNSSEKLLIRKGLNLDDKDFTILFVGNGFLRKGLPQVIKALEEIYAPNIKLLVAGNGNRQEISFQNKDLEKNTQFLGQVQNMSELYESSDLLIHPTLGDTFGMTVLEAMLHKIPVIVSSSSYCGISEILSVKEVFLLNDPKDSIEISNYILFIRSNPKIVEEKLEKAKKIAEELSWDKTCDKTLEAYKKIL